MIIKLKRLTIEHIKNVSHGSVDFTYKNKSLNVVGIYGANGSGKTTLVDAVALVKQIVEAGLINKPADYQHNLIDLIDFTQDNPARVSITLATAEADVTYVVTLSREAESSVINEEEVYYKANKKGSRSRLLLHYRRGFSWQKDIPVPLDGLTKGVEKKIQVTQNLVELRVLSELVDERAGSFLFNKNMLRILSTRTIFSNQLLTVLETFKQFSLNLTIYSSKISGQIYSDIFLPLSFSVDQAFGMVPIPTDGTKNIRPEVYSVGVKIFEQINEVLPVLIPNLTISLAKKDVVMSQNGDEFLTVETIAHRDEHNFPLRCESDGIKKIISILSTLINVYNHENVVAVIDELDAGIYEYLLGELVSVMSDRAKGLLIFTSHNLRPLEVLPYQKIEFTTVNPKNRYITIRNIKPTNNLRDVYLRAIQLGGMEEKVFNYNNEIDIKRAFRKAGRKGELKKND